MSTQTATRLTLRELAAKAYEVSSAATRQDRRDRSRRLLWDRLSGPKFGLEDQARRVMCDEVGFLPDNRAYVEIEGIRFAGPLDSTTAGLWLIHEDGECQVHDIADLGRALAELEASE